MAMLPYSPPPTIAPPPAPTLGLSPAEQHAVEAALADMRRGPR